MELFLCSAVIPLFHVFVMYKVFVVAGLTEGYMLGSVTHQPCNLFLFSL
jgi:hypothetical protein